jgi:hypothetical protein
MVHRKISKRNKGGYTLVQKIMGVIFWGAIILLILRGCSQSGGYVGNPDDEWYDAPYIR